MTGHLLCAPDKFRSTATASEVAHAVASAAAKAGWTCDVAPMADGGEGSIDVISGETHETTVTGPLGSPVDAKWKLSGELAIIEMAQASGYVAQGDVPNNAIDATTRGTGELIAAAINFGANRIVVGAGGSITTDGGLGAIEALQPLLPLDGIELLVAADVRTAFRDCARIYAPQKGASPVEVSQLEARLDDLTIRYKAEFGVDVSKLEGAGAAGGLAGGLAAIGARIVNGFSYLAELVNLDALVATADLVVTGEGKVDFQSAEGKVVDGVVKLARKHNKPTLVIAGVIDLAEIDNGFFGNDVEAISLVDNFGEGRALNDTLTCVAEVVTARLRAATPD